MQLAPRLRKTAAALMTLALAGSLLMAGATVAQADDIRNRQYWLEQSGIVKAWEVSQGEGVKVAIIDSGVDTDHKDLKGAVVGGIDMSGAGNEKGSKGIGAEPEHGTLVATMLAGRGHPAPTATPSTGAPKASSSAKPKETVGAGPDGVIGVAPKAELLSISVWLGTENPSGKNIDDQIPAAVTWAVDQGAKVINMSLGSTSTAWPQSWDDAFAYAEANDVVIVAAAGNRKSGSEQVGAPATIPGILAVGGLDKDGTASIDSSSQGISIGVSAPAEDLAGGLPGGGYASWSGTSGAAPIVSGVAALIRSKYPEMSAAQVINRIISTAKPKGEGIPNAIYGYGILDAEAALTAEVPEVTANPMGSISEWIRVHRRGVAAPPTTGAAATTVPQPKPSLTEVSAPVAIEGVELDSSLPKALILGSAGLLALILAAGSTHLLVVRRKIRAVPEAVAGAGARVPGAGPGAGAGTGPEAETLAGAATSATDPADAKDKESSAGTQAAAENEVSRHPRPGSKHKH
ncbi:S8 family serine peptidase [Specibacter sp. NPDC078709]|uniref:S8 family serine peptidase n=1 Tax=Specibacter sp. NPDC078709 TaxID=3154364 RepID=UPI0034246ADF